MVQKLLQVGLPVPTRRVFDYLPPPQGSHLPQAGVRVRVPFGRGKRIGIVTGVANESSVAPERLRPAIEILDHSPLLDKTHIEFLQWAAAYYHWPVGEVFAAALPAALRQGRPLPSIPRVWRITPQGKDAVAEIGARAVVQKALLEKLLNEGPAESGALREISSSWKQAADALAAKGWVETREKETSTDPVLELESGPALNAEQRKTTQVIAGGLGEFGSFLIQGVTGSGKTEVYLNAMAPVLAEQGQVLVLVPEIGLTPQLVERFRRRFGHRVQALHSGMAAGQRLSAWQAARTGQAAVIIGTRSAVFVPFSRLKMIVVDEEHDASLKQQDGFRYSARDLAVVRARQQNIPVLLGSATPALETLENARSGRYVYLQLPYRAGAARPPSAQLVDLRKEPASEGVSAPVLQAMSRHLNQGGQVMVYLNRRGYAPTLLCTGCGALMECARCDARLVLHQQQRRLVCHHCGRREDPPGSCPQCDGELCPVGQGTERVGEYLQRVFPDIPMVRIDRDTTRRRGELERRLQQVSTGQARLILGTQMLAKGHDFPQLTMVALLDADQGLFGTDFRAAERLAQTFVQVSGRAGRGEKPGQVYLQTLYPEHPLLHHLLSAGYAGFAAAALQERHQAGWPPYTYLALIRAEAADAGAVETFLAQAAGVFRGSAQPGVDILGPAPAPMERRSGQIRGQLLLRATHRPSLQGMLDQCADPLEKLPAARKVRWSLDVDPADLF